MLYLSSVGLAATKENGASSNCTSAAIDDAGLLESDSDDDSIHDDDGVDGKAPRKRESRPL